MKDQVLSIDQMQYLKDLGIDTSKASMWYGYYDYSDCSNSEWSNSPHKYFLVVDKSQFNISEYGHECKFIPTFTLQDMFDLLPKNLIIGCIRYFLEIHNNNSKEVQIRYKTYQYEQTLICLGNFPNIMTAAYEMLCWLAENGYMKTEL